MSILHTIKAHKQDEIAALQQAQSNAEWRSAAEGATKARPFAQALADKVASGGLALIAELKRSSPTKGVIREQFDAAEIARSYAAGGATCLSVLTDQHFFGGQPDHFVAAQQATALPALRKDFIFDPVQVWQSRAMGADCILLILSVLDPAVAIELETIALSLGMDVILECHDDAELDRALAMSAPIIGLNNRDLTTFAADLGVSERLARRIGPDRVVVSESGIGGRADIVRLASAGVRSYLIGESLMREPDIEAATRQLLAPIG